MTHSRKEEEAYFTLRKQIQAKLDKLHPGRDTNKLRAHERALREMGHKVESYRTK
jgi:hypothetical protein